MTGLGQTVAGYDFIADVTVANDGNGRDSNPADPGDNTSPYDTAAGTGRTCPGPSARSRATAPGWRGSRPRPGSSRSASSAWAAATTRTSRTRWSGPPAGPSPASRRTPRRPGSRTSRSAARGPVPTYMQSAVTSANNRGTVVVVAAGNSSANLDCVRLHPRELHRGHPGRRDDADRGAGELQQLRVDRPDRRAGREPLVHAQHRRHRARQPHLRAVLRARAWRRRTWRASWRSCSRSSRG